MDTVSTQYYSLTAKLSCKKNMQYSSWCGSVEIPIIRLKVHWYKRRSKISHVIRLDIFKIELGYKIYYIFTKASDKW